MINMTKKIQITLEITVHRDVSLNAVNERVVDALSGMQIDNIKVQERK